MTSAGPDRWLARVPHTTFRVGGALIVALALVTAIIARNKDGLTTLGIAIVLVAFGEAWLTAYKLEIREDRLRYSSLFGGTRELQFQEILESEVLVGVNEYMDRFRPHYRLVVRPVPSLRKRPIIINLKMFTRQEVLRLFELHALRIIK